MSAVSDCGPPHKTTNIRQQLHEPKTRHSLQVSDQNYINIEVVCVCVLAKAVEQTDYLHHNLHSFILLGHSLSLSVRLIRGMHCI